MKRLNKKGFTLIELIMVIVIIAILAVVAIPKYLDLKDEAAKGAMMGVVGGIRGGIRVYRADCLASGTDDWPDVLDSAVGIQVADADNPLFGSVLDTPIEADWTKVNDTNYTATGPDDPVGWYYHPGTGKFDKDSTP
ncbi:type II secretion system protein [bacterium]|nr:type II secretion system protein [bacterium]